MDKHTFCRLLVFDCKKGIRENIVKWIIAVLLFSFLVNVTIKNCLIYHKETGYLGYLTGLFQGMPEYVKSDTSIFELPVCWLIYYAYLFFLIGFYPISDLYGSGMKTLLLSGDRKKWIVSKYIWIACTVTMYFFVLMLVLLINSLWYGNLDTSAEAMLAVYGIDITSLETVQILAIWVVLPVMISIAMAFLQFTITICLNALAGYTISVVILVASAYWMHPLLFGNYLMIIRSDVVREGGMNLVTGIVICIVVDILSILLGYSCFKRKDIY